MLKSFKHIILIAVIMTFAAPLHAATVISEQIIFLKDDGKQYLSYSTKRSNYSYNNIFYEKRKNGKLEDNLEGTLYFYPNNYRWDTKKDQRYDLLYIPQGSYAQLNQGELPKKYLTIGTDGIYSYTNWDGKTKTSDGHYGRWNRPDNFQQFAYVWVFPNKYEILGHECNRKGDWVLRNNTIAYYGKNVNDLVFTIKYRLRNQATFDALSKTLAGQDQVQLTQQEEGVKITVGATVLFPSGSSELTGKGQSLLLMVTETLKKRQASNIIIEGHTDNTPINGNLANTYPSNWELSGARTFSVLHYLASNGIAESRLQTRAFGSQRPVASNDTAQGRAKNRRIELVIVDK